MSMSIQIMMYCLHVSELQYLVSNTINMPLISYYLQGAPFFKRLPVEYINLTLNIKIST